MILSDHSPEYISLYCLLVPLKPSLSLFVLYLLPHLLIGLFQSLASLIDSLSVPFSKLLIGRFDLDSLPLALKSFQVFLGSGHISLEPVGLPLHVLVKLRELVSILLLQVLLPPHVHLHELLSLNLMLCLNQLVKLFEFPPLCNFRS